MEKNISSISEEYLELAAGAVAAKRGRDVEQYRSLYEDAGALYGYLDTYINELNNARFKTNAESYDTLRTSLGYMQTFSTAILFVAILGNMFVLLLLSSTITKPLTKLAKQAEQVGQGDFDIDFIQVESGDEVGVLADAFNKMIESLNAYVTQIKVRMKEESRLKESQLRMESSLKESQLIFLQSQINPHFLYNTLNAGAQLAMMEGAEKLVCSLKIWRTSFATASNTPDKQAVLRTKSVRWKPICISSTSAFQVKFTISSQYRVPLIGSYCRASSCSRSLKTQLITDCAT